MLSITFFFCLDQQPQYWGLSRHHAMFSGHTVPCMLLWDQSSSSKAEDTATVSWCTHFSSRSQSPSLQTRPKIKLMEGGHWQKKKERTSWESLPYQTMWWMCTILLLHQGFLYSDHAHSGMLFQTPASVSVTTLRTWEGMYLLVHHHPLEPV